MFRSEDTDGFRLSNGIRRAIPDLKTSGAEATGREDIYLERGESNKERLDQELSERDGW